MKRKQPIQPAPQALKRDLCPCGVDARTQHQCRWRPVVKSPQDVHRQHDGPQNAVARNSSPNGSAQQRRIMIIGSLPSARRKNKAAKLGINGTSALHPRLKGMPVDVFHPEPFNAYPIPTIGVVHRMTEHYLHVWAPQQGKPFGFDGHPNPYLSLLWPYALQNATIFEGLVAMCRASWLLENGQDTLHDRAFAYHHNNTKYALQKRLDNPSTSTDDITLLAVLTLTTIDYTLGEHSLAEQYLQSVRHMVQLRGGVRTETAWDQFLASVITAFDALWTFILSSDPQAGSPAATPAATPSQTLRNAIPVYANHPFSPEYAASLAKIPQGFTNLAVSGILSVQCVRIIERIPHKASSPITEHPPPSPSTTQCKEKMHTILTDLLKLTTLSTTKIEHVLCYGLVAYCLPLQYGIPLPIGCTRTLQTCVEAYMKLNFSENEEKLDGKCLLWVAVVLSSCLDICADQDLRHAPVLERMLTRFPQARKWETVEKILRSFLWHEDLSTRWYATWQGVMSRRRSPPGVAPSQSPLAFTPSTVPGSSPAPSSAAYTGGGGGIAVRPVSRSPVPIKAPAQRPDVRSMKVSSLLIND